MIRTTSSSDRTSSRGSSPAAMTKDFLTDSELDQIEDRAQQATPGPWAPRLETRGGTGGGSFIDLSPGTDNNAELYLTYSPVDRIGPSVLAATENAEGGAV